MFFLLDNVFKKFIDCKKSSSWSLLIGIGFLLEEFASRVIGILSSFCVKESDVLIFCLLSDELLLV